MRVVVFFFVPFHHGDCPSEKYINRKKRRWAREKERKGLFTTLRLHRRKCAPSTGGSHFENEQERKVAVNPSDLSVHHWRICHQTISSHPVEECQGLTLSLKKTSSLSSSTVVIKNDTRQGKWVECNQSVGSFQIDFTRRRRQVRRAPSIKMGRRNSNLLVWIALQKSKIAAKNWAPGVRPSVAASRKKATESEADADHRPIRELRCHRRPTVRSSGRKVRRER